MDPYSIQKHTRYKLLCYPKVIRDRLLRLSSFPHRINSWNVGLFEFRIAVFAAIEITAATFYRFESVLCMKSRMRAAIHRFKVLWTIIVSDVVHVMHVFAWEKVSAYLRFYCEDGPFNVFGVTSFIARSSSWMPFRRGNVDITVSVCTGSAFPSPIMSAMTRRFRESMTRQTFTPTTAFPPRDGSPTSAAALWCWRRRHTSNSHAELYHYIGEKEAVW